MTRAFRGGIDKRKKVNAPTRIRNWNPIRDLRGLKIRTSATGTEMGPLVDVPAMIRIEDEHWVFERVEERVLKNLTHRLIIHDSAGAKTIGATENMETAMQVAQKMATLENKIVDKTYLKQVPNSANNTLVDEVEEYSNDDTGSINLEWGNFPCVL